MKYPQRVLWQFDTANFRVVLHVEPEDIDPADHFDFPEDVEAVRTDSVEWFCAFVSVWYGKDEDDLTYLAHDVLGGCAYKTFEEFYTAHRDPNPLHRNSSIMRKEAGRENVSICHYFPDMVAEACRLARKEMQRFQTVKVRAA